MPLSDITLFDVRSGAACLLALTVKQRFPAALLVGLKVTSLGFYCDFSFDSVFDEEALAQVEEMMLAWIRQKIDVKIREMVPRSAKEYFLFHKEPLLAKYIESSSSSSFFLAEIAGQMVLSESAVSLSDLGKIGAFCLQKIEQSGPKLRIYGTAFFNKKELKDFLKTAQEWSCFSHIISGEKLGLFEEEEGGWIWLPKGQKIRSLLKKVFEEEEEKFGFLRVSSLPITEDVSWKDFSFLHRKIFEKQNQSGTIKISECVTCCLLEGNDLSAGLLDPSLFQALRSHTFCQKKDLLDEVISSLHFMTKIFKILGFAFHSVLFEVHKGKHKEMSNLLSKALGSLDEGFERKNAVAFDSSPRIEWMVVDGLGRSWPIACLRSPADVSQLDLVCFASSSCLSFERVIALLLEKERGRIPFWMDPLQIRVVALEKKHQDVAKKTFDSLRAEGFRADLYLKDEELKRVLRRALEEGIPYVAVIGDKELETDTITLRDVRAKQARSLPWQELIEMLKKVN